MIVMSDVIETVGIGGLPSIGLISSVKARRLQLAMLVSNMGKSLNKMFTYFQESQSFRLSSLEAGSQVLS